MICYKKGKMFRLAVFIFVALTSGWLGVLVNAVLHEPPDPNNPGMGLWLVLPF